MTINTRRNIIELSELGEDVQDIEALKTSLNETISELNFILRSIVISNFDGEILTVTIPANSTVDIPHKLGIIPKYKLLLKQIGGGLIRDIEFYRTYVRLENTGGTSALIIISLIKD